MGVHGLLLHIELHGIKQVSAITPFSSSLRLTCFYISAVTYWFDVFFSLHSASLCPMSFVFLRFSSKPT